MFFGTKLPDLRGKFLKNPGKHPLGANRAPRQQHGKAVEFGKGFARKIRVQFRNPTRRVSGGQVGKASHCIHAAMGLLGVLRIRF